MSKLEQSNIMLPISVELAQDPELKKVRESAARMEEALNIYRELINIAPHEDLRVKALRRIEHNTETLLQADVLNISAYLQAEGLFRSSSLQPLSHQQESKNK